MNSNEHINTAFEFAKKNRLLILIIGGILYLLFFDPDSIIYQFKISREIKQLEQENTKLKRQIDSTKIMLKKMNDKKYLERYAREVLLLRKENEDIYLLDTTRYEKK